MTNAMMTQWHEFLASQGALMADGQIISYGDPQAELQASADGNILADLSHQGLIQLSGEDVVAYLQGQVTNDIKQLNGSNSQYAGYCNPKGRLLALFLAFANYGHVHLQLNGKLIEPIMKRLKMYVMRSKVTIADASGDVMRIGVAGKDAEASLQAIFTEVPQQPHTLVNLENGTLIRLPGPTPRYQIFSEMEHATAIWKKLQESHKPVGKACWEWLEIKAGIPDIGPETQEAFVPQMVNLDALGGINFKKGCYTGQEIVARTHYLGKVKRRTQLAHIASEQQPQPGEDIFAADGTEPVGKIVRAAATPQGGYDVLAEMRLESLAAGKLLWNGKELQIQPLPYTLPE